VDAVSGDDGPRRGVPAGADPSVDWPAEIRRARRGGLVVAVLMLVFPPGVVLLTGDFLGIPGQSAWWAAGVAALLLAAAAAGAALAGRRGRPAVNATVQAALRLRADPGPALRERVDATARGQRSIRWGWPFICFGAFGFYEQGRWGTPTTAVPGAALLTVFWGAILVNGLRSSAAARRWLSDPPGPPRPMPPAAAWEGRRTTRVFLFAAPVVLVLGLVSAVVVRAVTR
jgi:hypothetical protein